jgi:ABC-type transporter Mla subunit MlaD
MASQELKDTFRAFREQCIWFMVCRRMFRVLYESGQDVRDLLSRSAQMFFGDLNSVLQEYVIQQICKLTDSATSHDSTTKQQVSNLTVSHLNEMLRAEQQINGGIEETSAALMQYRRLVVPARHKLISHLDKAAVLAAASLGGHAANELADFELNLQTLLRSRGRGDRRGPAGLPDHIGAG